MARASNPARRGGRPQDPEADRRILDAAKRLLGERGFGGLSVEAVAAESGVAKTTIYRRWPSKLDLAGAAISEVLDDVDPGDLGSTREELLRNLKLNRERIDPAIPGSLLAEEAENPQLLEAFRERVIRPRFAMVAAALERGIERGDLRADLDVELATDQLVGAFFAHYLHRGRPGDDWPERLLDAAWPGLAAPGG